VQRQDGQGQLHAHANGGDEGIAAEQVLTGVGVVPQQLVARRRRSIPASDLLKIEEKGVKG
jgi:hypothetical protein